MTRLSTATATLAITALPAFAQDAPFQLDDIIFSAGLTALDAARVGATVEVVTEEDLAAAGEVQIADYLARLPGLSVTTDGPVGQNTFPRIRGLDGRYIAVRINGIDINDPSLIQNQTNFGGLTTAGISRIEVLYGSQSALYGSEAVAGVIDIQTTEIPNEPGQEWQMTLEGGSYDTAQASLSYGVRGARGGLAFTASRFVTDGFSAAEENDGNAETDGHAANSFALSGSYDLTDTITLGFDAMWLDSFTEFDSGAGPGADGPQTQDVEQRIGRVYAQIDGAVLDHEISLSGYETDRYFPLGFTQSFNGERRELRYLGTYDISADSVLSFGLERSEESFRADTISGEIGVNSAFADLALGLNPDLDLSLSARVDNHSLFGTQSSARVALAWRPDAVTTLRASIGQGSRAPSLFELYSAFGDPTLDPESSLSFDLGIEREIGDLTVRATGFWIEVENLIGFDGASTACGSGFGCYNQVPGTTRTQGLELAASYDINDRLEAFGAYTYTDTRTQSGGRLPRVPRHQVSLGLSGEVIDRVSLSVVGTGAMDTPVSAFAPNALDDYFVVDSTIGYELRNGIEAYLRIDNLFDTEYQTSPGYGTSDRAFYLGLRASF